MQTQINENFLIDAPSALRWYRPQTETEKRLLNMLIDLQQQVAQSDKQIEQLNTDNEELQQTLADYVNFYSDILQAFQDNGVWPDDAPRCQELIDAICEQLRNGA